ncbi:hypothetical protein LSM04_000741 [Trypanosoma melophagium]|uniref:uncharacterized protein n=1 Tax=Trypanosoma melophagium TaxID=715481 RepID=UPI00351A7F07|nr:hypothetical protein LSM04_000741 [Trypanosoma melophagium]
MITFSPTKFVVAVILLVIPLIATSLCIYLTHRLCQLRNEQRVYDERQNERSRALSREEERLRSRQRLLRRAVVRILACGAAGKGIPLATEVQGAEVLTDRPLRSQRTRMPDAPERPMMQLDNGTAVTVTEFVEEVRAHGRPPDALPGPTLLHILHDMQQQERQQRQRADDAAERRVSVVDELWEELQQLDEEEEREAEEKRRAEREELPDAEQVYGKGLPYTLNPANMEVVYILDDHEDEERYQLRPLQRRSTMKSLDWILTPLLKRKGGGSFDSPRRPTN